jgi:hypothetical protein
MGSLSEKERSALDDIFSSLHPSAGLQWKNFGERCIQSVETKVSPLLHHKKWMKYFHMKTPSRN